MARTVCRLVKSFPTVIFDISLYPSTAHYIPVYVYPHIIIVYHGGIFKNHKYIMFITNISCLYMVYHGGISWNISISTLFSQTQLHHIHGRAGILGRPGSHTPSDSQEDRSGFFANYDWLVVTGTMEFYDVPYIYIGIITPTDWTHIFQRGGSTTNQMMFNDGQDKGNHPEECWQQRHLFEQLFFLLGNKNIAWHFEQWWFLYNII